MIIKLLEEKDLDAAKKLAYENYIEECRFTNSLPKIEDTPNLSFFVRKGLGVAAYEDDKLVGFLASFPAWDNAFGSNVRGTFIPLHAHGAVKENRERIYKRMYQSLAELLVSKGVLYHGISFYTHDNIGKMALFQYGFGMRCCDGIKKLSNNEITYIDGITYKELSKENVIDIRELRKGLFFHLHKSPCFMSATIEDFNNWIKKAETRDTRVFVAKDKDDVIAFFEVTDEGENFIGGDDLRHFCGAYCKENHRGKIASGLLSYIENTLYNEGIKYLGVDFESFNPTAYGFWNKYFDIYTNSLTRRVDECGLN
ncbi:MAG: GNAT family N-acetyltransferase [Acholeplasmatales bacterium]|nr:GNAT family N-acetyltransferase [Acholeplasmatales bacterium]